jgi:hypothetical protein
MILRAPWKAVKRRAADKNRNALAAPVHKPGKGLRQNAARLHVCMQTVSSRDVCNTRAE